ncbi:MAG: TonB-dependent receptor [Gammaproteobacteria bacterium]|nr:TonB-dependent receptor [Gammaproteobacteria bacterium]
MDRSVIDGCACRLRTLGRHAMSAARVALLLPLTAHAANFNELRGIVHDADHRPVAQALVELKAVSSAWSSSTHSGQQGEFSFAAVPVGDYLLSAGRSDFATTQVHVTVVSGAAAPLHVQLAAGQPLETVMVSATLPATADTFTPTTLVDRESIQLTPGAERTNSLAMITNYVPGAYVVHDQLHVRGGHQVSWEIDGVEVPNTNIASNLGPQIDPKDVDYLEIERGGYAASEGDRTYGVFNVVPRTGFERDNQAEVLVSAGNYGQTNDALSLGSHSRDSAYYVSVNFNRSDLGLMTPSAEIIHDDVQGYGAFATFIYNVSAADQLRLVTSARRDDYQVPNVPGQLADDWQREADAFGILSWVHTLTGSATLTSSLLYHYNRADYDGASWDFPISSTAQRSSSYFGGQERLRLTVGRNTLDAGVYGFGQQDSQYFHIVFNDGSLPPVVQSLPLSGNVIAAWVQDSFRLTERLTLSAGLRQTHFEGLITENATDPRIGLTLKLPPDGWVLRAFWGKFYQPPPLTTLSGPLLEYAQNANLGFLPLHGERDEEYQFGLTIPVHGWSLDIDHFQTRAENFFDHNPLGNSDVFLPITISGALIRATELTVRSPRFWAGEEVYLTYSNQTADGFGAITGGLTDFSPPAGYYALDHDQRNTLNAGLQAQLPWHAWASMNLYFGSGFSNGAAPPSHLPSHGTLDLSLGKAVGTSLSASLSVLNVTDKHLLIDNSLTFDGVHWNYPREVYASFTYRFAY